MSDDTPAGVLGYVVAHEASKVSLTHSSLMDREAAEKEAALWRRAGGLLGGLWELPGGKVQRGETLAGALAREIVEEVGLEVQVLDDTVRGAGGFGHTGNR